LQNFTDSWHLEGQDASLCQNFIKVGQSAKLILQLFKMAVAAILDFGNPEILLAGGFQRVEMHLSAKFYQN